MARIAVVTSHPPGSDGGHLILARALERALRAAGHDAAVIYTPEVRFGAQAAGYWANWRTDVSAAHGGRRADQVISLRFPSYAVRHPVHACWLNHRMREYYDLWDRFRAGLSRRARVKEAVRRRLIHSVDRYLLRRNVTRVFALSRTIQARLARWGGIDAEVLHPPPPPRAYRCDDYDDYLFVVSRLTPLKRIGLIVEALARPEAAGIRCVIGGDGEDRTTLQQQIETSGLGDRVELTGWLDDAALVTHLARCRAVCFPPVQEDYGFVTVEAFASRKPVITCVDSGGPAELVESGVSGLISEPSPAALATAIRTVMRDRALAERFGEAAQRAGAALTWDQTVSRLVLV